MFRQISLVIVKGRNQRCLSSNTQNNRVGVGTIRASSVKQSSNKRSTLLTELSHRYPVHLIPVTTSSSEAAGAAVVSISSYGGGMVAGDETRLELCTESPGAVLAVVTQGSTRVYCPPQQNAKLCQSIVNVHVASESLLVYAPDPTAVYRDASLSQTAELHLQDDSSSLVWVDWFSSGRGSYTSANKETKQDEFWSQSLLSSNTLVLRDKNTVLVERIRLEAGGVFGFEMDPNSKFRAFATVILHGPKVRECVLACNDLARHLMQPYCRVRVPFDDHTPNNELQKLTQLSGRVLTSISQVDENTHVARIVTTSNEDMYRVLHACLGVPLQPVLGTQLYRDRIHSMALSAVPDEQTILPQQHRRSHTLADTRVLAENMDTRTLWAAYLLADSGLPTGGFAHSAGLEAASQMCLLEALPNYIETSLETMLQQMIPMILTGHELHTNHQHNNDQFEALYKELNTQVHALLVSNATACRASLSQGEALRRIASKSQAATTTTLLPNNNNDDLAHFGPVFGILASSWGLTPTQACHLMGYVLARDLVSSAVRLNLLGPLQAVEMLRTVSPVVEHCLDSAQTHFIDKPLSRLDQCATRSPVVETIQPCHDLLAERLFRT